MDVEVHIWALGNYLKKWVSGYCLTPTIFQRDDDDVRFVLEQHS